MTIYLVMGATGLDDYHYEWPAYAFKSKAVAERMADSLNSKCQKLAKEYYYDDIPKEKYPEPKFSSSIFGTSYFLERVEMLG